MPELPEVESVRLGLQRLLPGKIIQDVTFDWAKGFPNAPADVDSFLKNAIIKQVRRRAKVLIIDFTNDYSLIVHLKMTGQLVYVGPADQTEVRFGAGHPNDSLVNDLPDRSTRVTLTFTDRSHLFFNDQRKFGWMKLLPTDTVEQETFFQKVGPEPLEADFTWQVLRDRLQRRKNTSIKAAILDQTVVAGVGNIYADESLWGAKIHPATLVRNVSDTKLKALHRALVDVLNLSIAKGGSSNHTYVNAEGKKGSYMNFANVFRRDKQPCPRCGTTIEKSKVAGRGTHTCPRCQSHP
jgi:formamidopyrimidine-DNA glycosylase